MEAAAVQLGVPAQRRSHSRVPAGRSRRARHFPQGRVRHAAGNGREWKHLRPARGGRSGVPLLHAAVHRTERLA